MTINKKKIDYSNWRVYYNKLQFEIVSNFENLGIIILTTSLYYIALENMLEHVSTT